MQAHVDDGKLPFAATAIVRLGETAWSGHTGLRDVEGGLRYSPETLVRIYSMTKPVTSIALMTLYEKALFHLDDPIEEFLPEFAGLKVLRPDARDVGDVEDLTVKPTVHHLLTHMSGLTYGSVSYTHLTLPTKA